MRYYENNTVFSLKNFIILCLDICIISYTVFVRTTEGQASIFLTLASVVSFVYIMFFIKGAINEISYKKTVLAKLRRKTFKNF